MAKPTKPTAPEAPLRSDPVFPSKAQTFLTWLSGLFYTYVGDAVDFVDARADEALAAATFAGLPSLSGKGLNMLRVNAGATAMEFRTPTQVLVDIGGPAVGDYVFTAASIAPVGALKCNGAAVSRTTYAALFALIGTTFGVGNGTTTFNLPDFRGEFPRGWDDGRGIDTGRVIGSAQAAAMLDHTHTGTTSSDGAHTHALTAVTSTGGTAGIAIATQAPTSGSAYIASAGAHTHTLTTGNPSAGGGAETRPRNIALLICIRYQ